MESSTKLIDLDSPAIEIELCIICQKNCEDKLTTGSKGRKRLWSVAQGRKDTVFTRLLKVDDKSRIKYHLKHSCYRKYTTLSSVELEKDNVERSVVLHREDSDANIEHAVSNYSQEVSSLNNMAPNNSLATNEQNSSTSSGLQNTVLCFICNRHKYKKDSTKSRISEQSRAENLLKIAAKLRDDVFDSISCFETSTDMLAAQLHYHKACIRSYEYKGERATEEAVPSTVDVEELNNNPSNLIDLEDNRDLCEANPMLPIHGKRKLIFDFIKTIEIPFFSGDIFLLSEARHKINRMQFEINVTNAEVKAFLVEYFGENISFSYSTQVNKSALFYFSKISVEKLVDEIYDLKTRSSVKECAILLRNTLKEVDFGLTDKYCDERDLRESWKNIEMTTPWKNFFSSLFKLDSARVDNSIVDDCESDDDSQYSTNTNSYDAKMLKIKSVYQMIYYILHNGRKRTPLHVSTGLSVHHSSKSKTLVSCLNRTGISISYEEVERYRTGLASFTARSAATLAPLPSHFDAKAFTTAAFDNYDHEEGTLSGLGGTHDTVSVLFQDRTNSQISKPTLSESRGKHRDRAFNEPLKCQKLRPFVELGKTVILSPDFVVNPEPAIDINAFHRILTPDDFAWFLVRTNIPDGIAESFLQIEGQQTIPSWSAYNSIMKDDKRSVQAVGFSPILPYRVTDRATVYTAMKNFNENLQQLDQEFLVVACDEGVYKDARHIKMQRPEEMKGLILILGSFHMAKVALSCIGKYVKGSGVEDVFIETSTFGVNITEQVLTGSHYARSVKGYFMLAEALTRLQFKSFFTRDKLEKYGEHISLLNDIRDTFSEKNFDECKLLLSVFIELSRDLIEDFEQFIKTRSSESPLFKYWNNVLIMIDLTRDLIRADRAGNWNLHLRSVEKLQVLFHAMDRVNYSRWSGVYLEDMLNLEKTAPEVFRQFLRGRFCVKKSDVPFTSVGTDMALEQTINRTQNSKSGIIGSTKNKEYVASWDMVFHEILGVHHFYKDMTHIEDYGELKTHHEFNASGTDKLEASIMKLLVCFEEHVDPFSPGSQPLRNIFTEQTVDSKVADLLLNVFSIGCTRYKAFREERFVQKTKPLSAVIHRTNIPSMKNCNQKRQPTSMKKDTTSEEQCRRIIDIARQRNYPIDRLLAYELTSENPLFDDDGFLKKETNKSNLMHEVEKAFIANKQYESLPSLRNPITCAVIDVMLICRKIQWKNMKCFGDFAESFCKIVSTTLHYGRVVRFDFVFDSYLDRSPKTQERLRRSNEEITLHKIDDSIPLPVQPTKFWSSTENKVKFQSYLREFISRKGNSIWPEIELVLSATTEEKCSTTSSRINYSLEELQRFDIEEADVRMILHISHAARNGAKTMLLHSSDTDVFALILYFWSVFENNGLQELWMYAGTGTTKRLLPIHEIAESIGKQLCSVIVALHHLTGADYTSKVGTKLSALRSNPENYLQIFDRESGPFTISNSFAQAEEYLVQVLQKNTECKTFDELRIYRYHYSKNMKIGDNMIPINIKY